MATSVPTSAPVDELVMLKWYDAPTFWQNLVIAGLPISSLFCIILLLRVIWKPKTPKFKLPQSVPTYGATISTASQENTSLLNLDSPTHGPPHPDILQPGQVAGAYDAPWTQTFDLVFLLSMAGFFLFLTLVTLFTRPTLFLNGEFWLYLIPKFVGIMCISIVGGLLCRYFCVVDEMGYVMTTTTSSFKVNYTRKLQHFAAYFIPLAIKPGVECHCNGPLELAWGDFVTMLGFLVLIKPLRERVMVLMLQFNALDRPEDRPHTVSEESF